MLLGGIPFVLGFVGLIGFSFVRAFEVKKGTRFFDATRARLDRLVEHVYRALVLGEVPHEYRAHLSKILHSVTHQTIVFLVGILRTIERPLSRIAHRMRENGPKEPTREPSAFLKTIADVKSQSEKTTDTV